MSEQDYSFVVYSGDGVKTTFDVPFSYISTDDVYVKVDGVDATITGWPTAAQLTLVSAPASGSVVLIARYSQTYSRKTDYHDAQLITETDLDTDSRQAFNLHQENYDKLRRTISLPWKSPLRERFLPDPVPSMLWGWDAVAQNIQYYPIPEPGSGGVGGGSCLIDYIGNYNNNLVEMVSTIGSQQKIVMINTGVTLTSGQLGSATTLTIPENIQLWIPRMGGIVVNSGLVLTIARSPMADNYQIFGGSGSVVFGASITEVKADWFGDDTAAIQKAWDGINQGTVECTPGKVYTGDLTLEEAVYEKVLNGKWCKVSGNFTAQRIKNCSFERFHVGGRMEVHGAFKSKFKQITVADLSEGFSGSNPTNPELHYMLITNSPLGSTSNFGTFWNTFEDICVHGIIFYPGLYFQGGINDNQFIGCRSQGAASNGEGDHTDTKGAGLRIVYDTNKANCQATLFSGGDLSDNAYCVYNEGPWKVLVFASYVEQLDNSPVRYGTADFLGCYLFDSQQTIPFDFDNYFFCANRGRTGVNWFPATDLYGNPGFSQIEEYTMQDASKVWVPRGCGGGTYGAYGTMKMMADPSGNGIGNPYSAVLKASGAGYGTAKSVTTLTYSTHTKLITCVCAAHGYSTNWAVRISGVNEAGYNGEFVIKEKLDESTFTIDPAANGQIPTYPTEVTATGTIEVEGNRMCSVRFTGSKPTRTDNASAMFLLKGTFHGSKMNGGVSEGENTQSAYNCLNGVISETEYNVLVGKGKPADITEASWAEVHLYPDDTVYIAGVILGNGESISATPTYIPPQRTAVTPSGKPTTGAWRHYDQIRPLATNPGSDWGYVCTYGGDFEASETPWFSSLGQIGMRTYTDTASPHGTVVALRNAEVMKVVKSGRTRYWISGDEGSTDWYIMSDVREINQDSAPTPNQDALMMWEDTNGGGEGISKYYLMFNFGGVTKKVELT